jgi:hypothetical protein
MNILSNNIVYNKEFYIPLIIHILFTIIVSMYFLLNFNDFIPFYLVTISAIYIILSENFLVKNLYEKNPLTLYGKINKNVTSIIFAVLLILYLNSRKKETLNEIFNNISNNLITKIKNKNEFLKKMFVSMFTLLVVFIFNEYYLLPISTDFYIYLVKKKIIDPSDKKEKTQPFLTLILLLLLFYVLYTVIQLI